MKCMIVGIPVFLALAAVADPAPALTPREAFMKQQAFNEVQRVAGQVDAIESNYQALAERVKKIERGGGEVAALKADIDALRSEVSRLRNEMQSQRKEIVADLLSRIKQHEASRPTPPPPAPVVPDSPRGTYTVQRGDTLSLVAQAFGTTVSRLKEMNNLKTDALRVGQKLSVPDNSGKR